MNDARLDNPIFHALSSQHAALARGAGRASRYPPDVAPFAAVADAGADALDDLARLVAIGESVILLGVIPGFDARWRVDATAAIPQLIARAPLAQIDGPPIRELGDAERADMLELTALVYPHYFRPRTPEMGRYIGIYAGAQLAAMAGERMRLDGLQEISAVCTHPDHLGRGYAQRLVTELTDAIFARGSTPFLHVSRENTRAKSLYERLGYVERTELALNVVERVA